MLGIGRASVYRVLSRGNWCPDLRAGLECKRNSYTVALSVPTNWKCSTGRLRKATTTPPPSMTRYAALSLAIGLTCSKSFRRRKNKRDAQATTPAAAKLGFRSRTPGDTAARCNSIGTAGFDSERLGCISQQMEQHDDAQDSDWIGRRGDRHSRLDVECVRLSRRRWG